MGKLHFTQNMEQDVDMHFEDHFIKSARGCSVQNLSLHEELGKINYIFSDKTGTLTKNELTFAAFSFKGKNFYGSLEEFGKSDYIKSIKGNLSSYDLFNDFKKNKTKNQKDKKINNDGKQHYSGRS